MNRTILIIYVKFLKLKKKIAQISTELLFKILRLMTHKKKTTQDESVEYLTAHPSFLFDIEN